MGKSSGHSGKQHVVPSVVGGASKLKGSMDRRGNKKQRFDWYYLWRAITITMGLAMAVAVARYYLIATVRITVQRVHHITLHSS